MKKTRYQITTVLICVISLIIAILTLMNNRQLPENKPANEKTSDNKENPANYQLNASNVSIDNKTDTKLITPTEPTINQGKSIDSCANESLLNALDLEERFVQINGTIQDIKSTAIQGSNLTLQLLTQNGALLNYETVAGSFSSDDEGRFRMELKYKCRKKEDALLYLRVASPISKKEILRHNDIFYRKLGFCWSQDELFTLKAKEENISFELRCGQTASLLVTVNPKPDDYMAELTIIIPSQKHTAARTTLFAVIDNGESKFDVPASAQIQISVKYPGYLDETQLINPLSPGETRTVQINLRQLTHQFKGKCFNISGVPLKGVFVWALQENKERISATTDENGSFTLNVSAGSKLSYVRFRYNKTDYKGLTNVDINNPITYVISQEEESLDQD